MSFDLHNKRLIHRQTSFELLRIVSMIMIVAHHLAVHGRFVFESGWSINKLWVNYLYVGGKIGVNVFVLIAGCFLIQQDYLKIEKILKFLLQIIFYSVFFYIIMSVSGVITFSFSGLVRAFVPILYGNWFARTYFALYLIFPLLNIIIKRINRRINAIIIVICFFGFCIISIALNVDINSLIWFVFLYWVAAYIKLYNIEIIKNSFTILLIIAAILYGFAFIGMVILQNYSDNSYLSYLSNTFLYMNNPIIVIISILLFFAFRGLRIKKSYYLNLIASLTFGVYLIHDNIYFSDYLWNGIIKIGNMSMSEFFIIYTLFIIFLVFFGCSLIEYFRLYYLEKWYMKSISGITLSVSDFTKKIIHKANK